MTKRILCAVDINGPEGEIAILEQAAKLAGMMEAEIDVITVVPDFGASVVGAYMQDHDVKTAQSNAKDMLFAFCEKALGAEANAKIRHIVAIGSVYAEVLKAAKLAETDLIVIGANRPDLKDFLLGPNAARVVRHSECSVYVIR